MASGASRGMLGSIYEGSIVLTDMEIDRRPYHRNCSCALHKSNGRCYKAFPRERKISYPIRRSWSEGCLSLAASNYNSSSASSSPASVTLGLERENSMKH
ncbi:hypothetical protein GIB67_021702 [Kingdonia uniflora]|uniref:Uncharacterized protein n=1 Tax=Kingdonia uniflora TaxID=39325 RepID=A0A7J7LMA4_9MAGN|nr:hypothetical protein GIB67_021702 [Kingdonia uniflora]